MYTSTTKSGAGLPKPTEAIFQMAALMENACRDDGPSDTSREQKSKHKTDTLYSYCSNACVFHPSLNAPSQHQHVQINGYRHPDANQLIPKMERYLNLFDWVMQEQPSLPCIDRHRKELDIHYSAFI